MDSPKLKFHQNIHHPFLKKILNHFFQNCATLLIACREYIVIYFSTTLDQVLRCFFYLFCFFFSSSDKARAIAIAIIAFSSLDILTETEQYIQLKHLPIDVNIEQ